MAELINRPAYLNQLIQNKDVDLVKIEQFLRLEKTSFSAVGQRKAPFEQRPAVPGVPLEVSIARLSLAERQDTVGQRDCPVRSLCPQML